jgi:hypothetical protein
MFLPFRTATSLDANGLIVSATTIAVSTNVAAYMSAVNNALSGRRVSVLSATVGGAFPITSVDVGNVVDTQRRRRNQIIEQRSSANVTSL